VACEKSSDELPGKWVAYQLQIESCKRQSRTPFKCEKEAEFSIDFEFSKFVQEMNILKESPTSWKKFQDKVVELLEEKKKQSVKPKVIKKKPIDKSSVGKRK
jgi:hypothetical protein